MNKLYTFLAIIAVIGALVSCARGCSEQSIAKDWGGETSVTLEPNQKLVEVTWKDASIWYLTRPMRPDEEAESYVFKEQDVWGWMEGSVTITERKMTDEEYQEWYETKYLEEDYYRPGNILYSNPGDYSSEPVEVYITYDAEAGIYKKLKPYTIAEDGSLIPME